MEPFSQFFILREFTLSTSVLIAALTGSESPGHAAIIPASSGSESGKLVHPGVHPVSVDDVFCLDLLAFLDFELPASKRDVVGSSPAGRTTIQTIIFTRLLLKVCA